MPRNSFENYPMSWRPTLREGPVPLYVQLATQLERDIADGSLRPGTKLPPQRELADFLDINVSTVSRAFKICSQKGLLSGTVGSGTYVAYDIPTNLFANASEGEPHLIELGSMTPEVASHDELTSLLQGMLAEPDSGRLFQYAPSLAGWQREAAAKLLARVGCPASADQILTASGGQNALAALLAALFRPGDHLGVDPLTYPGLKGAAKLFGIQLVPIRQEGGELSEAGLRSAAKNDGIRGVYVIPDCQNPTTHTMSAEGRQTLARVARELDLVLIEDGINSLLVEEKRRAAWADAPDQTVFVLSLSKTVSPALRLAYLAVPARYRPEVENALYTINLSQSSLLTELASRLIASGQLDRLLERRRHDLLLRNQLTDEVLGRYDVCGGPASLSRWLRLPHGLTGAAFEEAARERGVLVYGSERFAVGRDAPEGGARLAVCAAESVEELGRALTILAEVLDAR